VRQVLYRVLFSFERFAINVALLSSWAIVWLAAAERATLAPLSFPVVPEEKVGECCGLKMHVVVPITAPGALAKKALVSRPM